LGNGKSDNYVFPKYEEKYDFVNTYGIINHSKGIINEKIFKDINPLYYRKIKKISCGNGFTVCLDREGLVYSWGRGSKGELGYDLLWEESTIVSGIKCQSTPKLIEKLANRKLVITDVICGNDFTFVYDDSGIPYSWGNNDHYQLARVSQFTTDSTPDKATQLVELEKTLKICCGWMHGMVLTDKGEVYIWGNPFFDYNKNSPDIAEPLMVELPNRAVDIRCGYHHFCAIISEDGLNNFQLYTWGANEYSQCGYRTEERISYIPKHVKIHDQNVIDVSCGAFHTIVHASNRKIYGFGHNL
jgi:alpha-tubulin suppressor-like RCC1 family protein